MAFNIKKEAEMEESGRLKGSGTVMIKGVGISIRKHKKNAFEYISLLKEEGLLTDLHGYLRWENSRSLIKWAKRDVKATKEAS